MKEEDIVAQTYSKQEISVPLRKSESTWQRGLLFLGPFLRTFDKLLRTLCRNQVIWIWNSWFRQYSLEVPFPFITYQTHGSNLEMCRIDTVTLESNPPLPLPDQFMIQTIIQPRVSTMFLSHEQPN